MINIDTNVLVRALVGDDPGQAAISRRFLKQECSLENPGFVSAIVLAETCWVLVDAYGYQDASVRDVVSRLLDTPEIQIENAQVATDALSATPSKVGFVDLLIAATGEQAGCREFVTFDRALARRPGVRLLR